MAFNNDEWNELSPPGEVLKVLAYVEAHVYDPDAVDLSRFYNQWRRKQFAEPSKSARFIVENDIHTRDVQDVMARLTIGQYSTTAKKHGSKDAYVFGVHMPDILDYDPEIYLKFQIDNGFIIVTIHEADRPMTYPYRGCGK